MTSTQRRARAVKMTPPLTSDSSRQMASSATCPQPMNRIAATEYGMTRCSTSGAHLPTLAA